MKKNSTLIQGIVAIALLSFLAILLSGLQTNSFLERQSASAGVQASEEAPYPAALAVNSDIVTAMAAAEATDEHELATPTLSHIPTPLPTPAVTRVPVAKFPILSGPTDDVFTLIYLEDNRLLAIDSDGSSSRVLLDVSTRVPLYVATDKVGVQQWGSASPDGRQIALVLSTAADNPAEKGDGS